MNKVFDPRSNECRSDHIHVIVRRGIVHTLIVRGTVESNEY